MESLEAVRAVAAEVVVPLGVELLDVRWAGGGSSRALKVVVDQAGGISADACAAISRQFDVLWEAKHVRRRDFGLEITSPGPDRPLATERDFARVVGRWIKVVYRTESGRASATGKVASCAEGKLLLVGSDESVEIPLAAMERARMLFVIGSPALKGKSLRRTKR